MQRAKRTCELAGFGPQAQVDPDLMEWDYGQYEGRTAAEIRKERPDWFIFRDGCPGGESVAAVGARADARHRAGFARLEGRTILFGHSHFFRVLAARWLGLPPRRAGSCFSARRRSVSWATNITAMSRSSDSGTMTGTCCPEPSGHVPAHAPKARSPRHAQA